MIKKGLVNKKKKVENTNFVDSIFGIYSLISSNQLFNLGRKI